MNLMMHLPIFLGAFNPGSVVENFIPIVIFMIPIVAILTRHQQKMAEIIHGNQNSNELNDLRREFADLRNLVLSQSNVLDQMSRQLAAGKASEENLKLRLGAEQQF